MTAHAMMAEEHYGLQAEQLPSLWNAFKDRYTDRDQRMETLDKIVRGDYSVWDPDGEPIDSRSPNFVQVALEDTVEAASIMPTVRVVPSKSNPTSRKKAGRMELVAAGYFEFSKMELLVTQTLLDLASFGFGVWVVWPDDDESMPIIEKRDPRECYPEPGFRPGDVVRRCMFSREVYFSQLPEPYQMQLREFVDEQDLSTEVLNGVVQLVEWFDTHEWVCGVLLQTAGFGGTTSHPVILDRLELKLGVCPVVVASRFTLDGEFRGQFDQVIQVLEAHVRLMGILLDYADQAVYSDIWVKDLIGELSWGGGAYIELGPNGSIGRVPPAVSSLDVQRDLKNLEEGVHLGGRWPKSRPGEIDQSIASAKFIEAAAGMMNTTIKTYHLLLKRMMEQALRLCFVTDVKHFPWEKTANGVLRNQEFVEDYDPSKDIDVSFKVRVEYGLGLGRDPAQSAVLMLQYAQNEYISKDFVQENIDGLTDVDRERRRIDVQKFREMMLAKLLMGLEQGTIPQAALADIMEARERGDDLISIFRKFVVEPLEQPADPGAGPLGAAPPMPPPGMMGAPGAPTGGPAAPIPPPPPEASELLARIGMPAGPGGVLGAQIQG